MAWSKRVLALLRVWGVGRSLLLAVTLAVGAQFLVGHVVGLPGREDSVVQLLALVPAGAVLVIATPLVDQTPYLTTLSGRSPLSLAGARLLCVLLPSAVLFAGLAGTPWTAREALVVFLFLAGCVLCVALVGHWYWAPMTLAVLGWLYTVGLSYDPRDREVHPMLVAAALLLAGAMYLGAHTRAASGRRVG